MLRASDKSTRSGYKGLGNIIIRWRLKSQYSHSEIVFEPEDNVRDFIAPSLWEQAEHANTNLIMGSSTGTDRIPAYSHYRAGKLGGVRLKYHVYDPTKWDYTKLDPAVFSARDAIKTFLTEEGKCYDWKLIGSFVSWVWWLVAGTGQNKYMCSEICAKALKIPEYEEISPKNLDMTVKYKLANLLK